MKIATLVYIKRKNKTLMVLRNKKENDLHAGLWNGLGGKLEAGETPEECVVREVKEESSLNVKKMKLHGIVTFPLANGKDNNSWYVFVYTVSSFSGKLSKNSPEGDLKWISDKEIPNLKLNQGDYMFFPWLERGKFFSASFVYGEKGLKSYKVHFY